MNLQWLLVFVYFIPGETQPMLDSGWYAQQATCEARLTELRNEAIAADLRVLYAKCEDVDR